jgi:hypothetical protein
MIGIRAGAMSAEREVADQQVGTPSLPIHPYHVLQPPKLKLPARVESSGEF